MYCILFQDAIYYTLIGNDKAMEYFYVDPKTGVVSLKKSILRDSTARYDVSNLQNKKVTGPKLPWAKQSIGVLAHFFQLISCHKLQD